MKNVDKQGHRVCDESFGITISCGLLYKETIIPLFQIFSLCSLFDSVKALIIASIFHNEKLCVALVAYMFIIIQEKKDM